IGKKFWKRVYEEAAKKYGTTNIPVNTFNKVWIVPEKAVVYENAKAGTAYVVESKLKVMLEQDYLALQKNVSSRGSEAAVAISKRTTNSNEIASSPTAPRNDTSALGSQIVREIVIPELTKEVNENKNFAQLRQVYNSLILATWYKKKIKDSILAQVYADKNKVAGVGYESSVIARSDVTKQSNDTEIIYQRYLAAFKKGVYNYIKEEQDPITNQSIPRKYFSGGFGFTGMDGAMVTTTIAPAQLTHGDLAMVSSRLDNAMPVGQLSAKARDSAPLALIGFRNLVTGADPGIVDIHISNFLRSTRLDPVKINGNILVLGFGSNAVELLKIAKLFPKASIIGTDLVEDNVIKAQQAVEMDPQLAQRIQVLRVNKFNLSSLLEERKAQIIYAAQIFNLYEGLPELKFLLDQMDDVMAPGGYLYAYDIHDMNEMQEYFVKHAQYQPVISDGNYLEPYARIYKKVELSSPNPAMSVDGAMIIHLQPLTGKTVLSYGAAQKIEFQRQVGDRLIRQEVTVNPDEKLQYAFEIHTQDGQGIGALYATVNTSKKEIFVKRIQVDENYKNRGYATSALSLLKEQIFKDGYGDYQIKAEFSQVSSFADYSRRAFEKVFIKISEVDTKRGFDEVTFSLSPVSNPAMSHQTASRAPDFNIQQLRSDGATVYSVNDRDLLFTLREGEKELSTKSYFVVDAYDLSSPNKDKIGYVTFSVSADHQGASLTIVQAPDWLLPSSEAQTIQYSQRYQLKPDQMNSFEGTYGLWVRGEYRKNQSMGINGVGTLLMSAAIRLAQEGGVQRFYIDATSDPIAQSFYRNFGARDNVSRKEGEPNLVIDLKTADSAQSLSEPEDRAMKAKNFMDIGQKAIILEKLEFSENNIYADLLFRKAEQWEEKKIDFYNVEPDRVHSGVAEFVSFYGTDELTSVSYNPQSILYGYYVGDAQTGVSVGEIYFSVNNAEKRINLDFIRVDPEDQGYGTLALAIMKAFAIAKGYEDYKVVAEFNTTDPKAEYSRKAFVKVFKEESGRDSRPGFEEVTGSIPIDQQTLNFIQNSHDKAMLSDDSAQSPAMSADHPGPEDRAMKAKEEERTVEFQGERSIIVASKDIRVGGMEKRDWDSKLKTYLVKTIQAMLDNPAWKDIPVEEIASALYQAAYALEARNPDTSGSFHKMVDECAKILPPQEAAVILWSEAVEGMPAWGMRRSLLTPEQEQFVKIFRKDPAKVLLIIGAKGQNYPNIIKYPTSHNFQLGFPTNNGELFTVDFPFSANRSMDERRRLVRFIGILTSWYILARDKEAKGRQIYEGLVTFMKKRAATAETDILDKLHPQEDVPQQTGVETELLEGLHIDGFWQDDNSALGKLLFNGNGNQPSNPAMKAGESKTGGIDLTPANMNLQTQNPNGEIKPAYGGFKFNLDPVTLQQLKNAPGFTPVIINIQPMNDLRLFLGIKEDEKHPSLAVASG
ncbi:MAG: GNAT family N-acetyltransferase, partial [Candidatus Omnitrophica bacterium]|nr:GNAT family N-acetyltransferase [Candidatus Omnitrophota bacterium]